MNPKLSRDEYYNACVQRFSDYSDIFKERKRVILFDYDNNGTDILYTYLMDHGIGFEIYTMHSNIEDCLILVSNMEPIPIPRQLLRSDVHSIAGFIPNREDFFYRDCFVGRYTTNYHLFSNGLTKSIGRFCAINPAARVVPNHPTEFVSTHGFTSIEPELAGVDIPRDTMKKWNEKYGKGQNEPDTTIIHSGSLYKNKMTVVGNDVWIGVNARIISGVKIGDGAIIGAGAIVTKDVPPYAIVGGVPARVIKYRFSRDIIDAMLRIKWWDWNIKKIEDNMELFYQPEKFVEVFDTE